MNKFGFIVHPISMISFRHYGIFRNVISRILSEKFQIEAIKYLPPYKLCDIPDIRSSRGVKTCADIVLVPLLPRHIAVMQEEAVLKKIEAGISVCKKNGAKIIGLGALTSVVGNEGEVLSKRVDIPITSGNTLTASLALDGIYKAAYTMGVSLAESVVAIVGATGDIGSVCTKILSNKVKKLNIAARNEERLNAFADSVKRSGSADVEVFKYTKDAIKGADIILSATSAVTTIIDPAALKPGAIVCDVAIPPNIAKEVALSRRDIFVFEGGLAKLPYPDDITGDMALEFLPKNSVYGCIAETMTLALEGRLESYSIGRGNITETRLMEMKSMAARHGITVADFCCGHRAITERDIENIRVNANNKTKRIYAAQR
jgi:Predicted dehydrogenase